MKISFAEFVKSSVKTDQLPAPVLPEFAFIGRSNVGKSSLINMLTQRKELAKTSGSPGKTQMINHFIINKSWYLVDLPGYGFAKVSQDKRAEWEKTLHAYTRTRDNLMNLFILVDLRIEPQKSDLAFIEKTGAAGIALSVVFTKSDKLGTTNRRDYVERYKKELLNFYEELPPIFLTSAETKAGRDEVLNYIDDCCKLFKVPEPSA